MLSKVVLKALKLQKLSKGSSVKVSGTTFKQELFPETTMTEIRQNLDFM